MAFRTGNTDPQSVAIRRARAYVPEFAHVLRCNDKQAVLPVQGFKRLPRNGAKWAIVLNCAEQNIGIDENPYPLRRYHRSVYQFSRSNASSCRTGW